jgi:Cupin-like domain
MMMMRATSTATATNLLSSRSSKKNVVLIGIVALLALLSLALAASNIDVAAQSGDANHSNDGDPSRRRREAEEEAEAAAAAVCTSSEMITDNDESNHGGTSATGSTDEDDDNHENDDATEAASIIQDLGLRNVESFLTRPDYYSIVLMYDKVDMIHDPETFATVHEALVELAASIVRLGDDETIKFQLGRLDIRQHADLRRIYMGQEDDLMSERFFLYDNEMIDSETFMNLDPESQYPPFISSQLSIFYKLNVVAEMMVQGNDELLNRDESSLEDRVQSLLDWLQDAIEKTNEINDYPVLHEARPKEEQRELQEYLSSDMDRSFPVEQHYATVGGVGGDGRGTKNNTAADDATTAGAATTAAIGEDDEVIPVDEDEHGETFFKYQSLYNPTTWNTGNPSFSRRDFGYLLLRYSSWAESYEVLWNSARRRAADEELNYQHYLDEMNERVYELLVENEDIIPRQRRRRQRNDEDEDEDKDKGEDEDGDEINDDLDLRQCFADLVFGFGRSASNLKDYIEAQILDVYGHNMTSIHDMQDNDHAVDEDGNDIPIELFVRIRQVMVAMQHGDDDEAFQNYMSALNFGLRDILAEFHENISRHYVNYRNKKRASMDTAAALDEASTPFNLKTPDVIDMSDPANAELLSDYAEFERRYTARGKPVVLSNVKLFLPEDTDMIEYLWEKCRHVNVGSNLKTTSKIGGHESNTVNIGHTRFQLPRFLMNAQRRASTDEHSRYGITFDQFQSLQEVIDDLYLFDYHPKGHCDQLFYDNTPYDKKQKMQLPYVIGGYDLAQRVAYQDTQEHPVLFVGKKGTNTKLHVDGQEEGFIMYLVSGRKRWMIYDDAEHPLLYERLLDNSFVPDSLALNKSENERRYFDERFPLLRHVAEQGAAYEFIQEPGQIVYLASGLAHAVENMEDSVGVSINFVLRAGVFRSMHHMIHVNADYSQLDMVLRHLLFEQSGRDSEFAEHRDPLYTTMAEYWSQS